MIYSRKGFSRSFFQPVVLRKEQDKMAKRKVKAEVTINLPPGKVFSYISNMDNHADWQNGVLESKLTSEGAVGVGSTYR